MRWVKKTQTINPIPAKVEIELLKRAYSKEPRNSLVFSKLIEALVLENELDSAIEISSHHLIKYQQDDHVYAVLTYLYHKANELDKLISVGEVALRHSPRLDTQLLLSYAYAQTGCYPQAADCLPRLCDHTTMDISHLRLLLNIHLQLNEPHKTHQIYRSLPEGIQADSGLKSCYIKALSELNRQAEIDRLVDYEILVKEQYLFNRSESAINTVNQQLAAFFKSHTRQQYEPGNHTTRYGAQVHFESDWHPSLRSLECEIKASVEQYFNETTLQLSRSFTLHLWANVLGKKGHQISHIHPDAVVSGVYYMRVPQSIRQSGQSQNRQGWLLLSQPETQNQHYVKPVEGLVVLFPSYFYHETLPLEFDETRMCIAFDVIKEDDVTDAN